ncbi:site-specific DNA-methyltransferase [Rubellimicrobium sp. CFH 75288]|uniref:site-specific DNA-methyltransferase n=1 Tax=Rubellimicrobium sp. CFH 75288 TaxID=2697034 RepID=UPI0014134E3B|nr:site-specific DNA-methyltransferase [Rubellimicrobium sp. CFH 75288]NAZ38315.1 site-specific DNA-methyltransferase [Rubellimicrobium sp. CFH 75288]
MPILNWLTRDEDIRTAQRVPYRLLEEVPELSAGDGGAGNMLIQGDNLEALKALLPFYAGRVKCIYIDPPYNTRSAFEHYDDNLEHTQWLAMMWPRLELLRDLLAEDGSIWVSIDDNEGHYLKVIMDEVFGRSNFECTFVWQKVDSPNDNKPPITPDHEFVLCYKANKKSVTFKKKPDESILRSYRTTLEEPRFHRDRLVKKNGKNSLRKDRPTMYFPLPAPDRTRVYPIHDDGREARWAFSCSGVKKLKREGRLIWKQREKNGELVWVPYAREFAPDLPKRPHQTILLDVKTSRQAKAHARELLPGIEPIETIKPEQLLERILQIATDPGDLVLDSFLGSGTTAAVAHKMGRRYIGIEMGEHAVSHCAPRLQKVIDGEQGGISQSVGWQGGGGFRFYRLGPPVFDEDGHIRQDIRFPVLAAHVWFSETDRPWDGPGDGKAESPLLGIHDGRAHALLYNGILGDKRPDGGNVLTRATLALIRADIARLAPGFDGPLTVYGEQSRLTPATLDRERITFKQTPYDVKARK